MKLSGRKNGRNNLTRKTIKIRQYVLSLRAENKENGGVA
jgi:hypothetical protein